jgi:hypothetical protein
MLEEMTMEKSISEFLKESLGKVDFAKDLLSKSKFRLNLNEADDDFAGDEPADDGGDDFSGDDLGGSDLGGDDLGGGDDSDSEALGDDEDAKEKKDDHENDPDFTDGIKNPDSPVLDMMPSAETVYDADGVFKSIKGVIEAFPKEQLVEIEGVKNCLELIFSGKKLKPEDLDFDNIENAVFLFSKIMEPLNDRTKNYAKIKLKQPLQQERDKKKLDIANKIKDIEKNRDTILSIDGMK